MQLIIQTNDGLTNADSYVSVDELQSYADKRGIVLTSDVAPLLIKAMDYLSTKRFKGEKTNPNQNTHFPVMGIGIPQAIKQAQMMLAVAADSRELIAPTASSQVRREKVDSIEVEYFESQANGLLEFPAIDALLEPYLDNGGGFSGWNIRVQRG